MLIINYSLGIFYFFERSVMKIGLIGATNAGKSTLFNRLIGQFRAIVTDIHGTTTDIIVHQMEVDGLGKLTFFDSPGLLDFSDELPFIEKIVKESDLLLFVIDDTVGVSAKDEHILSLIMENDKRNQTFLIVNKLDVKWKVNELDLAISDYYGLGLEKVIGISAKKERNLAELEDAITDYARTRKAEHPEVKEPEIAQQKGIGIAIVGKPNSGKSTLLNTLVGKELAKVEDKLGTTRDYLVGEFKSQGKRYTVYDTAGIRKKGKTHGIEKIAYDKTAKMLEFTRPVVIFLVDCTQGITHRDMTLLQEITQLGLPMIFALNKSDLVEKKAIDAMIKGAQSYLDFAKHIPIVPISALHGEGLGNLLKMVTLLQKENQKRIGTTELNRVLSQEQIQKPARFTKNRVCKIMYATQIEVDAPTFMVFVNHKARANFSFKKWIENVLRRNFGFIGVPLVIKFRERGEGKEDRPMPGVSLKTLKKEQEARQEKINRNAAKILQKRKSKKS
ncbi:MAG: ribosome biogenesis GTPase Der [candidate division SR1 bacterium]|nr:MAG: ribosome biogenesis GTPase Der [candidate division SR1 bacterium]